MEEEEKINILLIILKKNFSGLVKLIDDFNFDGDFIESQAFAYLAIRSYLKKFITFPEAPRELKNLV